MAGGTLGAIAMVLIQSGDNHAVESELRAALRLTSVHAETSARRCHELEADLGRLSTVARDMLAQIEDDDRAQGTHRAPHYRRRLAELGMGVM
ncbi:MAG: hypothetical protein IKN60_04550 [Bacteroidales bacterium]|nr:hypothetical protein [Bacteroidales bacterium]